MSKQRIGHLEYMVKTHPRNDLDEFLRKDVEKNDCNLSNYYLTFMNMSLRCLHPLDELVSLHFCEFSDVMSFEYVLEKMARLISDLFLEFSKVGKQEYRSDVLEKYNWSISEDLFLQTADDWMRNEYLGGLKEVA